MKYAFMQARKREFHLISMCRVLKVHRGGNCVWLREPLSSRVKAWHLRQSRILCDLKEAGVAKTVSPG
jgi:hypothetical protein